MSKAALMASSIFWGNIYARDFVRILFDCIGNYIRKILLGNGVLAFQERCVLCVCKVVVLNVSFAQTLVLATNVWEHRVHHPLQDHLKWPHLGPKCWPKNSMDQVEQYT